MDRDGDLYLLPENSERVWTHPPAFLGVFLKDVDPRVAGALGLHELGGVLITDVMKGSPAMAGGIKAGDVILKMDKESFDDVQKFREAIMGRSPGETVAFEIWRGKQLKKLTVELGGKGDS